MFDYATFTLLLIFYGPCQMLTNVRLRCRKFLHNQTTHVPTSVRIRLVPSGAPVKMGINLKGTSVKVRKYDSRNALIISFIIIDSP